MSIKFITTFCVILIFCVCSAAFGMADPYLPEEICNYIKSTGYTYKTDCGEITEGNTNTGYVDLDGDGTNELIMVYGGASCGSFYWVFKLDKRIKWKNIGFWCGCEWIEENPKTYYKVKNTIHNGYRDIWTCGVSGLFDGIKYVGVRQ